MTLGKSRLFGAAVIAGALALGPAAAASAAPTGGTVQTVRIVTYKTCTAMHKAYRNGVARAGVKYNKVSGVNRAFKYKPYYSTALYNANSKLDRDKDGVACERG
jgi:hypothetical protein